MPKLKAQIEQEKREKAIMRAVNRCKFELGIKSVNQLASFLHRPYATVRDYTQTNFQTMKLRDFSEMARRLEMTGREVCAAVGVPYEDRQREEW